MAEYIERAAAVKVIFRERKPTNSVAQNRMLSIIQRDLLTMCAADVAPVVHGHWIPISDGAWAECSECGEAYDVSDNGGMAAFKLFCDCYKSCPNCGAKMDGGADK